MNKVKIAVISDSHGMSDEIETIIDILKSINDLDTFVHLGDFSLDAEYIKEQTNIDFISVRGNCDFELHEINEEEILNINDKKILLTHGHKYNIKGDLNNLYYRAKELQVDAVLFGHIHMPVNIIEDDILLFNPGSISEPRGGSTNSYGILTIEHNIKSNIVEI
jgi:putative phosphoesterase